MIKSRTHPLVKRIRALRGRRRRAREGSFVIEGIKNVAEALRAEVEIEDVLLSARLESHPTGVELRRRLEAGATELLREASDEVLDHAADADADQGIIAVARVAETALDHPVWGAGIVVVAAAIQDPGNLGALIRTTEALGGTGVVAIGGSDPWGPKAVRATAGSLFRLPVTRVTDAAATLAELRRRGHRVVAAVAHDGERPVALESPVVLIIGSEGRGIEAGVLAPEDSRVTIPLRPPVESLNVVVAAAILLDRIAAR